MSNSKIQNQQPIVPSNQEVTLARRSSRILSNALLKRSRSIDIEFKDARQCTNSVTVPLSAFKLFIGILNQMAEGNAVNITSVQSELTTQQAADLLNVSRPYLIRLLEEKKIPFHKVGTRRKVLCQDILNYKAKIDEERRKVLDELTEEAQKLGMGY